MKAAPTRHAHDPGGKVRLPLADGVAGSALFSECGRYRYRLERSWADPDAAARAILWIGMNPSTADESVSDPTCRREETFSRDWGFSRYIKTNMLAWRSTDPRNLPADPDEARGPLNVAEILRLAGEADEVVMAFGRMDRRFHPTIRAVVAGLVASGRQPACLGHNRDGSAKHPLYIARATPLAPFDVGPWLGA